MNPFNKEQLILESNDCIETDLLLLGATGIEDRLQDGVADTILALKEAGIKVWVLTGDKKETAINVGYASNLLQPNFEIISLHARSEEDCLHTLARAHPESDTPICFTSTQSSYLSNTVKFMRNSWSKLQSFPPIMQASYDCNTPSTSSPKALVVDGQSLIFALSQNCSKQFLSLANECSTVICCRATPFQKAAVVQSVKDTGIVTLAIGDGANDVSMIQEANVGIGISGKEGLQAVLSSDFSMARFRYLKKLLLVHGHWCYSRLANMMLYFFYKNMTYVLLLFWFQLYNGFSGSNPVDGVNLLIYNLIYTSVPIGVTASIDQDLPPHVLLDKPDLYKQGRCSRIYTRWKFWLSIIEAIYQSLAIFFITYGTFYRSPIGMAEFGFVINIAAVLVVNLQLCIEILHWTIFHHLVMWTSCLLVFGFNYAYCALRIHQSILDVYYVLYMLSKDPRFWLVIMQALLVTMLPRIFCKFAKQNIFPNPVEKARQLKYVPPDASSSLLNGSASGAHASAT
jgi:phospholipid-translocating P-type ATPase (flippase)